MIYQNIFIMVNLDMWKHMMSLLFIYIIFILQFFYGSTFDIYYYIIILKLKNIILIFPIKFIYFNMNFELVSNNKYIIV